MYPFPALSALLGDPRISALVLDPAPALVFDSSGTLRFGNRAAIRAYGAASLAELIERSADLFGELLETAREFSETLPLNGRPRRENLNLKGGAETFRCERIALASGSAVVFTGLARERSDGDLGKAIGILIDGERAPFALFDTDGRPLHANRMATTIMGPAGTLLHLHSSAAAALAEARDKGTSEIPFGVLRIQLRKIDIERRTVLLASFMQPERPPAPQPEPEKAPEAVRAETKPEAKSELETPPVIALGPPSEETIISAEMREDSIAPEDIAPAATHTPEETIIGEDVPEPDAAAERAPDKPDVAEEAAVEIEAPAQIEVAAENDAPAENIAAEAPPAPAPEKPAPPPAPPRRTPSRFVWQLDADGHFTTVSADLAEAVGAAHAAKPSETWPQLAERAGIEKTDALFRAVQRRDTWSGVSVLWPVADSDTARPVDLAALPVFDRDRNFIGYRGFGVFRDAIPYLAKPKPTLPAPETHEVSAAEDEFPPHHDPVLATTDNRAPIPEQDNNAPSDADADDPNFDFAGLSPKEQTAFREIGRVLSREALETDRNRALRDLSRALGLKPQEELAGGKEPPVEDPQKKDDAPVEDPETDDPAPKEPPKEDPAIDDPAPQEPPTEDPAIEEPEKKPDPVPAALVPADLAAAVTPAQEAESERALLDRLPLGIAVHRDDHVLYANRTLLEWLGLQDVETLANTGNLSRIFSAAPELSDGSDPTIPRTLAISGPTGEPIPVETKLFSTPWHGQTALVYVLRRANAGFDERRETIERALRAAEASTREHQAILDTATDGVLLIDHDGKIIGMNKSAEALFGFDFAEIQNASFTMLFAPESHRAAVDYLDGLASNGVASVLNDGREVVGRERQGGLIPLFMTLGKIGEDAQKFCAVLRDITQWKRAEEELTGARRQAEEASSHKSDFLAKISHEMRTPLNAIIGFAEVMMEERFGPIGNERYREYLKDIHQSGGHLISLINDLLDLSKIEAGKLELNFSSVDINAIAQQCMSIMQPQANRERIIIRTALAGGLPPVVADARSIRQIVLNLLSNSVKFTKPGGQVIVSTSLTDTGEVVMRVRDTGVGMSEDEVQAALEPFRQLATSGRSGSGGTGLGLPLTKALVEANRASFTIKSAPDSGTLIEVAFPSTRVLAE